MDIKLIAVDLDGTLLDSQKKVSEKTYATLTEAVARGIWVVPSTGRTVRGLPEYIAKLPFLRYIIAVNGASVWDKETDEFIFESKIPLARALEVIEFVQKYDAINDSYVEGGAWMDQKFFDHIDHHIPDSLAAVIRNSRQPVAEYYNHIRDMGKDVQKIQMFFHDNDKRLAAIREIEAAFPELLLTCSQTFNIEINAADANKGNALNVLCKHLGIDIKQTMAFGDGGNDESMLCAAGFGVAMKNGTPEIQAVADYITLTNDEHGVADAIEKLIFAQ